MNENGNKEPFAVEFGKLSSYLDLTPSQMDEVYDINEYFKGQQKESLSRDTKRQRSDCRKLFMEI